MRNQPSGMETSWCSMGSVGLGVGMRCGHVVVSGLRGRAATDTLSNNCCHPDSKRGIWIFACGVIGRYHPRVPYAIMNVISEFLRPIPFTRVVIPFRICRSRPRQSRLARVHALISFSRSIAFRTSSKLSKWTSRVMCTWLQNQESVSTRVPELTGEDYLSCLYKACGRVWS